MYWTIDFCNKISDNEPDLFKTKILDHRTKFERSSYRVWSIHILVQDVSRHRCPCPWIFQKTLSVVCPAGQGQNRAARTFAVLVRRRLVQDLTPISQEVAFGIFRNEKIGGSFFSCDSSLSSKS